MEIVRFAARYTIPWDNLEVTGSASISATRAAKRPIL